jgi:hypothetical protein
MPVYENFTRSSKLPNEYLILVLPVQQITINVTWLFFVAKALIKPQTANFNEIHNYVSHFTCSVPLFAYVKFRTGLYNIINTRILTSYVPRNKPNSGNKIPQLFSASLCKEHITDTPAHASPTKRREDTCFGSSVFRRAEKSLFEAIIAFVRPQEKEVASGCSPTTLPAALHSLRQLRTGVSPRQRPVEPFDCSVSCCDVKWTSSGRKTFSSGVVYLKKDAFYTTATTSHTRTFTLFL